LDIFPKKQVRRGAKEAPALPKGHEQSERYGADKKAL